MTKPLLTIMFSIALLSCQNVGTDIAKENINRVCDKFMETFRQGQYTTAMDLLRENSVLGKEKIDTLLGTIKEQMPRLIAAYGKIVSSEFIRERKIKDFLTKRFYILKFEKYYLRFDFTLYKSSDSWAITAFSYDDNLIEVLY
jgi:hypothetical protein